MMKQYKTMDEYISDQSPEMKPKLKLIRKTISKLFPDAEEVISYGIPTFRYHGILMHYAVFKNHYSFFFGPAVTKEFLPELGEYETSKGTIKVPAEQPVPVKLLSKITRYAAKQNLEKVKQQGKVKKSKSKK